MRAPVPSRRTVIVLAWIAVVVVLLLVVWLAARVLTLSDAVGEAEERATSSALDRRDLRGLLEQQGTALDDANDKLVQLGEDPVESPPVTIPTPTLPLQGPQGPRGLMGPRGVPGDDGDDGRKGTDGTTGQVGTAGATGPQGPQGPAGEKGEKGDTGPAGPSGPAGPPGPAGTITPGSASCPAGEYATGITVAADGSLSLACAPVLQLPGGGPQ